MADTKISELTELAASQVVAGDQLAIVDNSASETKRITHTELKKLYGNIVTGTPSSPTEVSAASGIAVASVSREVVFIQGASNTNVTITASPKIAAGANDGDTLEVFNFTSHIVKISMTSGVDGPGQLELGTGYNQHATFIWVEANSVWWNISRSNG